MAAAEGRKAAAAASTASTASRRPGRPQKVPSSRSPLGRELTREAAKRLAEQQERASVGAGRGTGR